METLAHLCKKLLKRTVTGGAIAFALTASNAFANPEPGALYDARSAAMAGTGVAYLDSGAASFHNPANMDKIGKSVTTLTFSPFLNEVTAPWPGAGSLASGYQLAPLGQLGTAWRVHERIVVGANVYAVAGAGIKYSNYPSSSMLPPGVTCGGGACSQQALILQAELQIPVSIKIMDGLSVGVAYRMTYGSLGVDEWLPGATGMVENKISASASNFKGVQVGLHYEPIPELEFGLNWRNSVTLNWSGSLTVGGVDQGSTAAAGALAQFNPFVPANMLSGGVATHLLDQTLMLTAEYRYYFYAHENKSGLDMGWQNAYMVQVGGEYKFCPQVPLRVGLSYGTEATTDSTANPFGMPPGNALTLAAGSGYDFGNWVADLSFAYAWWSHDVSAASNPQFPGTYKLSSIEIFASGTYKF